MAASSIMLIGQKSSRDGCTSQTESPNQNPILPDFLVHDAVYAVSVYISELDLQSTVSSQLTRGNSYDDVSQDKAKHQTYICLKRTRGHTRRPCVPPGLLLDFSNLPRRSQA